MTFSGALGGVAEAERGVEEGTSDDTSTVGTALAPDEAVPLGGSDVLISGRDGRCELSIGGALRATEGRAIAGAFDRGMVFCSDDCGFSNAKFRLWRVESTKRRLSTTTLTPSTCPASRTAAAR